MKNKNVKLSLEEKLKFLTGKDCWSTEDFNGKLDKISVSDGPCGLRKMAKNENEEYYTVKSTAYPCVHVLSNSWNTDLAYEMGQCIADDCIENDVDVILAPGVNIKRQVLNGRNFEYFSEDPYLAGTMAKRYIDGVQDKGIGTSLKHFCANNFEQDRLVTSSEVDERTLNEIYYKPFEIALKANPTTVMCSYNRLNGILVSEHQKLLKGVLREKLGFNGLIVSDWDAVRDRVKSLKATVDLEMPFRNKSYDELKQAYDNGEITMEQIDFCVNNVLTLIDKLQEMKTLRKITTDKSERRRIAKQISDEGEVLLKNDGILPLKPNCKIALFSLRADRMPTSADGSARVQSDHEFDDFGDCLKKSMPNAEITNLEAFTFWRGEVELYHVAEKLPYAYDSDVAIVLAGNDMITEGEAFDRQSMKLQPRMESLIKSVASVNKNTIVVLSSGSAVDVSNWESDVKAILYTGFAGETQVESACDILAGKVCPSGKLTETFAKSESDYTTSSRLGNDFVNVYKEGVFVGYRYFDTFKKEVAYPFGFGLSYASFTYSDLTVEKTGDFSVKLSYIVKNESDFDAKEVSQIYVKDVFSYVLRPEKELKAFSKDLIKAGESKKITVELNKDAFSYYSVAYDKWIADNGDFEILVASNVSDVKLKAKIKF